MKKKQVINKIYAILNKRRKKRKKKIIKILDAHRVPAFKRNKGGRMKIRTTHSNESLANMIMEIF